MWMDKGLTCGRTCGRLTYRIGSTLLKQTMIIWSPKVWDNLIPGCQKKNGCTVHLKKHHQFEIFFPQQSQTALTQKFFLSLVVSHVFQCFDMCFPFVSRWFPRKKICRSLVAMFATHPRLALLATLITPINMLLVKRTGKTVAWQKNGRLGIGLLKHGELVGGCKHEFYEFHFIYGMSSQPHWLSLHHFSRWLKHVKTLHHQPGKNNRNKNSQALFCLGFIRFPVPEVRTSVLGGGGSCRICPDGPQMGQHFRSRSLYSSIYPVPIPILILYLSII